MRKLLLVLFVVALATVACGRSRSAETTVPVPETTSTTTGWEPTSTPCTEVGHATSCSLDGYPERPFEIDVPQTYDGSTPTPVVLVLHGGGGNSEHARQMTCLDGDLTASNCLFAIGEREGFITVYPNGTGTRLADEIRTWNAGGGDADYACASGRACDEGIDDIAYIGALLDEVARQYRIDTNRVYATGFSNGAAMSHRLGCELADRIAAIATVSGGNQHAASDECKPERPMPVFHIHGRDDPCWTYDQSNQACLDHDERPKIGVRESTLAWVERNGCDQTATQATMPDAADDGMTTTVEVWEPCTGDAVVRLATIEGGGHVFPSGSPGRTRIVGEATTDWGAEEVWAFLSRFALED